MENKNQNPQAEQMLQTLTVGAISLLVSGVVLTVSSQIMDEVGDDQATCDAGFTYNSSGNECINATNETLNIAPSNLEYNVSRNANTGLGDMAERLPTIGVVIGAIVVIGLLVLGFSQLRG